MPVVDLFPKGMANCRDLSVSIPQIFTEHLLCAEHNVHRKAGDIFPFPLVMHEKVLLQEQNTGIFTVVQSCYFTFPSFTSVLKVQTLYVLIL